MNGDELRRALAVCRNLLRDALTQCEQCAFERLVVCVLLRDLRISCSPVRKHNRHIVRAHVAVDRDHIEAVLHNLGKSLLEQDTVNIRIRCDKAEYRCHIGANHARALCDDAETDFLAAEHNGGCSRLGVGIRRDDGVACIHASMR